MSDLGDFTPSRSSADDASSTDDTPSSPDGSSERFETSSITASGADAGIGAISSAQGLKIAEDADDTGICASITAGNRSSVRLGKYLLLSYPDDEKLFCRITELEYVQEFHTDDASEIHVRRAMRNGEVAESDYKFLATLEPIAVLYNGDGELKRRMADRVPKPEAVVREATDTEEIKTGLKMPDDGVFLGHLAVGGEKVRTAARPPTIDYRLKDDYEAGDPLVFRHTLVAGGTGSGKTHGAKNVLRQYLHPDRCYELDDGRTIAPAVVQFDPQDEYAQMHDDNPGVTSDDERAYEREGIACGGHDDTKAFVPAVGESQYSNADHRAEQVEFTIPFSMVRENKWLVAGSDLNDNQYSALTYLLKRFFKQHGDSGTYSRFKTFLDDPALREELDESGRVHEATFDAVKRRARGFDSVFDQSAPPITDLVHEFVRPGGLSVVAAYHINDSRATEVIVLALSSLLVDQKLSNDPDFDRIKETPLVLGMDEAHNFLSGADSAQGGKVIGKFAEAAKQGRKERLGLFFITQDPQDIADAIFKQINTKIVLNLGDEDAISAVNIPTSLAGKVPYMEKGQMVVYSPDNSEPVELIGLSNCLTKHE
ncbi:MAG: ATP-binding protein [Halalkalicoccus sp.]